MRRLLRDRRWLVPAVLILLCVLAWPRRAAETSAPDANTPTVAIQIAPADALRKIEPELLQRLIDEPDFPHDALVEVDAPAALPQMATLQALPILDRRQLVVNSLKRNAEQTQSSLRSALSAAQAAGQVTRVKPFWVFNGLAVSGRRAAMLDIARRNDVRAIRLDRVVHLPDASTAPSRSGTAPAADAGNVEWNIHQIRADLVWSSLGIDGRGVVVGSLDTGVDWQHPALLSRYRGNTGAGIIDHTPNWLCATDEGYSVPTDVYGHGTHTMGTIVGQTNDHSAIGVAPGARWIAVKIFNDHGNALLSWIHAGFQWMLDPGGTGNPALVPDVVNNSWGSQYSGDGEFLSDVQAWRSAGIVPMFAAGNDGPGPYSIDSPGSFQAAIAVGATDSNDYVTSFSSRGPSPWQEIKPEVSAPGLDVNSAAPGGGYAIHSGTSMATPHVTGLTALLLQANPRLSVDQIENLLTSTAVRRGAPIPNNDYGWGRIDALQAVAAAAQAGHVKGRVQRFTDRAAVPYASVEAHSLPPQDGSGQTQVDSVGGFDLPLAAWRYDVTVSAFGYHPVTAAAVNVVSGTTTTQNFQLSPLPTGRLQGHVSEADTEHPLSGTITISGTPIQVNVSGTGSYAIDLPDGAYTLTVRSPAHRVAGASSIPVTAGGSTEQDFTLAVAPRVLLVDSGAWYGGSQAAYFRTALEDMNYNYDVWTIHNLYGTNRDVPATADLQPYDVVIWSCPSDSPGYAEAWEAITTYLNGGGRLFLTGQNIGYWDSPSGQFPSEAYSRILRAQLVKDKADTLALTGQDGSPLQGVSVALNGPGSADNQVTPDVITLREESLATGIIQYEGGALGGLERHSCVPYRLVYLAFGFEGISDQATRHDVLERIVNWLVAPPEVFAARISPGRQTALLQPGHSLTYTVYVHNQGMAGQADTYHLSLSGASWPTFLATDTITVAACATGTVMVRVDVPPSAAWNTADAVTITAQSTLSPTLQASGVISTHTPAPILLVDHDRWYNMESIYKAALDQNGLPYDYWDVGWNGNPQPPSAALLRMHPIIIWFTGYDWYNPMTTADEGNLAKALDAGNRLWLVSADYLNVRGLNSFGSGYLGLASYSPILTTTEASGIGGDPLGNTLGPYALSFPFPNRSEAVTPLDTAEAAFLGSHDQPIAVHNESGGVRTAFFSFPLEAISSPEDRREVTRQAVGQLSWLGSAAFAADQSAVQPGTTVAFTLTVPNNGPQTVSAAITGTLPEALGLVSGSLSPPEAFYDVDTRRLTWSGPLAAGNGVTLRYLATVSATLPAPTRLINPIQIGYSEHHVEFDRFWALDVAAPDLSRSRLTADRAAVQPRESLTYTIVLRNDGLSTAPSVTMTNPIPAGTAYLTGSIRLEGSGTATDTGRLIRWDGSLAPREMTTLTYRVDVTTTEWDAVIQNVAYLYDGYGPVRRLRAETRLSMIKYRLPVIVKSAHP